MESLFDQCCETDETEKKANMRELDVIAQWIYLFAQRYCLPDKQTPVLLLMILDQCLQKAFMLLKIYSRYKLISLVSISEQIKKQLEKKMISPNNRICDRIKEWLMND